MRDHRGPANLPQIYPSKSRSDLFMSEPSKAKQVLSTGQVTFLFLMIICMLVAMFAAGVYVGRISQPVAKKDGSSVQMLKTNISFFGDSSETNISKVSQ